MRIRAVAGRHPAGILVLAIALSYRTNWPLGFFVGIAGAAFYLLGQGARSLAASRIRPAGGDAARNHSAPGRVLSARDVETEDG